MEQMKREEQMQRKEPMGQMDSMDWMEWVASSIICTVYSEKDQVAEAGDRNALGELAKIIPAKI